MPDKPFIYQLKDALELAYRDGITRILDWHLEDGSLTGRFLDGNELFSFEVKPDSVSYEPETLSRKDAYLVGFLASAQGVESILTLDTSEYWAGYLSSQQKTDKASLCKIGRSCGNGCVSRDKGCRVATSEVKRQASAVLNRSKTESFQATKSPKADQAVRSKEDEIRLNAKESAHAYDMDGNLLFSKDGEQTAVYFTDKEMKQMKGSVMTHNHPAAVTLGIGYESFDGGSFSDADWACASYGQVGEIRAVGPEARYSLTPPKEGWSKDWWKAKGEPTYRKHHRQVYKEVIQEYRQGSITLEEADAELSHRTSQRTAKELGMKYTREPNKVTEQDKTKILATVPKKREWGW